MKFPSFRGVILPLNAEQRATLRAAMIAVAARCEAATAA